MSEKPLLPQPCRDLAAVPARPTGSGDDALQRPLSISVTHLAEEDAAVRPVGLDGGHCASVSVCFAFRTLGRCGGPGVTRKWTCRVESSGGTGHQGVAGPAFAPGTLVPLSAARRRDGRRVRG